MTAFVDTSAFLAIINKTDSNHAAARATWQAFTQRNEYLIATNYIVLETFALVQRRHGLAVVRRLKQAVDAFLHIHWVEETIHAAGVSALLAANRRQLSLVDCISFDTMRRLGIDIVFTFDEHFAEQDFICVPRDGNVP
jgi:predicted nucleic acid-binding protein